MENDNNQFTKYKLGDAVIIIGLTTLAFFNSYFFEIGYCRFFNIPAEYIELELTRNVISFLIALTVFYFIASIIDGLIGNFLIILDIKIKIIKIILILIFSTAVVFVIINNFDLFKHFEISLLLGCLIIGFILSSNSTKKDSSYEIINPKFSILVMLSKKIGSHLSKAFYLISFSCFISFTSGIYVAKNKSEFYLKNGSSYLLLKKYGNVSIYGNYLNGKIDNSKFIIQENLSKSDTLIRMLIKK